MKTCLEAPPFPGLMENLKGLQGKQNGTFHSCISKYLTGKSFFSHWLCEDGEWWWLIGGRSLAKKIELVLTTVLRMQMTLLAGSEYSLCEYNGSKLLFSSYYVWVVCLDNTGGVGWGGYWGVNPGEICPAARLVWGKAVNQSWSCCLHTPVFAIRDDWCLRRWDCWS